MQDRALHVFLRGTVCLAVAGTVLTGIGQWLRPDLPIADRAVRMVVSVAPFMDSVFDWFRT